MPIPIKTSRRGGIGEKAFIVPAHAERDALADGIHVPDNDGDDIPVFDNRSLA
jgi:hypothetical protein